jgi:hypothetical protein
MKKMKRRPSLLPVILFLLLAGCGGGQDSAAPRFSSIAPQRLTALGVPLSAYVIISTHPDQHFPLTLDDTTNNFTGNIQVDTGSSFDLTVVYTAADPTTGEDIEIAHYVREGLTASGNSMQVAYEGDETNWQTLFDLDPGHPNALNLDGDAYSNFLEIGYGSDPTKSSSLPTGPKASATHKDQINGTFDVDLPPPGSDLVASIRGDAVITLTAITPFTVKKIEVISPTTGYDLVEDDTATTKSLKINLHSAQLFIGQGTISMTIRVTDEFDMVGETTFTFAVANFAAVPRLLVNGSAFSGSVREDQANIQIDGSQSAVPDPSTPTVYKWVCIGPNNYTAVGTSMTLNLTLPNVSRAEGSETIICTLSVTSGTFKSDVDLQIPVTFVNQPPTSLAAAFASNGPDDFTATFNAVDADNDTLTYDVVFTPTSNDSPHSPTISCTGLLGPTLTQAQTGNCTLSGDDSLKLGAAVSPLRLTSKTDYTIEVTAHDPDASAAKTISGTVTDDGLVGWWRMSEGSGTTTADSSGKGYTGTFSGTAPVWTVGADGNGLSMPAYNDPVTISGPGSSYNFSGDFTLSAWIKASSDATLVSRPIAGKHDQNSGNGYLLDWGHTQAHKAEFYIGGVATLTSMTSVDDGNWHQLVGVYHQNGLVELYLDGEREKVATASTVTSNTANFVIGNDEGSGALTAFNDTVDEVSVYDRALSVDEIRQDCRRNNPSSGGTVCPDPKKPIILMPLPSQTLPPTRAFWSWRGEKDKEGNLLYSEMEYEAKFDVDQDGNNIYNLSDFLNQSLNSTALQDSSTQSWYYAEDRPAYMRSNQNYRLKVDPIENGTTLTSLETTRTFSTDNSVLAWWKLDDGVGTEASEPVGITTGYLSGASPTWTAINSSDKGLTFSGNGYVDLTLHRSNLIFNSNSDCTMEARFRPDAVNQGQIYNLFNSAGAAPAVSLNLYNGKIEAMVYDARGSKPIIDLYNSSASVGSFYHAAMAYDGENSNSKLTLTVNGQQVATGTNTFSFTAGDFSMAAIGAETFSGISNAFSGLIDEVVVYGKVLSPEVSRNNYCALEKEAGTDPLPDVCFE